jgi:hypothetical protein
MNNGGIVKPGYNVSLGAKIFQCYIANIKLKSRLNYMGAYGEGENYLNFITR